jgi:hypothetical protein
MSTLDEYGGHANPTETRLKRGDTRGQIDGVLQQFDVLPSSVDRFIFKYISLYLLGLFVPGELFLSQSQSSSSSSRWRRSSGGKLPECPCKPEKTPPQRYSDDLL